MYTNRVRNNYSCEEYFGKKSKKKLPKMGGCQARDIHAWHFIMKKLLYFVLVFSILSIVYEEFV